MTESNAHAHSEFTLVPLDSLSAGMLMDREMYVYLKTNMKFVRLVKPMVPLEPRSIEKFKKAGGAYARGLPMTERFLLLEDSARTVAEVCANEELAPFEKNREVRSLTDWLVPYVLGETRSPEAPVFFLQRAFGLPRPETLLHLLDESVASFERCVVLAAVSGVLALWLGYTDPNFVRQFVETVFCRELANAAGTPGTQPHDFRFSGFEAAHDELADVVRMAGALFGLASPDPLGNRSRVARKLGRQFNLPAINVELGASVDAGKAAA